jgi:D-alanyl-lipoteichoic acid acyltransferase DltB (MBOAT superfamily)/lysophospholipase L1-like esterase
MRPFRSFLLLFFLLVCLSGLNLVFPGYRLFPSLKEFIHPVENRPSVSKTFPDRHSADKQPKNSINASGSAADTTSAAAKYEEPGENRLAQVLDSLYASRKQVRILYYGDSQIEGDRITSWLRQTLRKGKEGSGPGLFQPLMPVMYTKSVWLRSSSNWKRYNYLSYKTGKLTHDRLGPFMAICRYLPEGVISGKTEKAYVRIRPSQFADSAAAKYDVLRIFYSNPSGSVDVSVTAGASKILDDSLKTGTEFSELECRVGGAKDILIEFRGKVSPDIYGMSIESKTGIVVDNIPQRGSAGLEFTMVDRKNLSQAYAKLSPDIIILHYGLNIVRNVRNEYSYYKKGLSRQIARIKEAAPSAALLVVSVTDMASGEGDSIESYRNIPSIVESQKEAAREYGTSFWDAYDAMGGRSSIIMWSRKQPPLAQADHVHFTYQGADTLSKMLYSSVFAPLKAGTSPKAVACFRLDTMAAQLPVENSNPHENSSLLKRMGNLALSIFTYHPDRPFIFTNPSFWLFFLVVMAGYSLTSNKVHVRNLYLLLISLFFYFKSGGLFLSLLVLVTVVDFTCGLLIYKARRKMFGKLFIFISLFTNLGILAYFKYAGFIIDSFNSLFGTSLQVHDFLAEFSNIHLGTSFNVSNIILPVGISFFTFQSLSYTIDMYRGKMKPVRNIIDFGFYVSFFPQLIAGPINRASEFIPQIYTRFSLSKREFGQALFLICKGLIKKIIISDFIAVNFVDRVFDLPSVYSGFENLMAVYGYGLQIYCDFSGYTDIAIGLGLLMGFRLPVNFNSPYKAANISDFWRRWHISLSRWLKDYLYISLGGNRKGKIRTYFNLFVTMLLGGLWHGAALRFIIWGGLHGIGLVINKIWNLIFGSRFKPGRLGRAVSVFITFNFISFCWIFFRAPDMAGVMTMLRQITGSFSPGSYSAVLLSYSSVFLLIAAGYAIHFLPEKYKESYRGFFIRIPLAAKVAVVIVIALVLQQMRTTDIMPFIYFRF